VAQGTVLVNGQALHPGDALMTDEAQISISNGHEAELLLFDLA
jgi:redox-sensitive bicupin YhaK (pirin superfamily)